jgi:dipeptidase
MALKNTMDQMRKMLSELSDDLEKAEHGNKAAAQRVRTNTIKFAKVAKTFRKESVAAEKKGTFKKSVKKSTKTAKKTSTRPGKKTAKKTASRKKSPAKKAVKKKALRKRGKVKSRRR